jgi:hypothetical protein
LWQDQTREKLNAVGIGIECVARVKILDSF